jgi:hypothetical protein
MGIRRRASCAAPYSWREKRPVENGDERRQHIQVSTWRRSIWKGAVLKPGITVVYCRIRSSHPGSSQLPLAWTTCGTTMVVMRGHRWQRRSSAGFNARENPTPNPLQGNPNTKHRRGVGADLLFWCLELGFGLFHVSAQTRSHHNLFESLPEVENGETCSADNVKKQEPRPGNVYARGYWKGRGVRGYRRRLPPGR